MRPHSIESKPHFVRSQQRMSSEAPEAHNSVSKFYQKQSTEQKLPLRRCESASSLARCPSIANNLNNQHTQQLNQLGMKYKALEEDYRRVLQ